MASEIRVSRLIKIVFGLALAGVIVIGVVNNVGATSHWEGRADITDFHAFYIVGRLIWSGQFVEAYHASTMMKLEAALGGGRPVFMPWSYPPLFGIVVGALAALPLGWAFLVFVTGTLGLYVWATARLDPVGRWPVILASLVGIVLNLRCGQNGLLTAAIVAAGSACLMSGNPVRSGLCLGLMAFKPHLVPLVPILLVSQRRWTILAIAALGAITLTALSIAIFGIGVFSAFLHALPEVGRLMTLGAYPLHRMTSIFAFAIGIGLAPWVAMLLHGGVAAGVLVAVARLVSRDPNPRLHLGLVIMAGFFISPYVYDYDFVVFGVGLMLASPALRLCLSQRDYVAILIGYALAQSLGFGMNFLVVQNPDLVFSPCGPAVLTLFCCILRPLWRGPVPSLHALGHSAASPDAPIEVRAA